MHCIQIKSVLTNLLTYW